jgi:putative drug exporter of the RND superfamily
MLARLTDFLLRQRRAVLVMAAVLALVGAAAGATLFSKLTSPGFDDPNSASGRATAVLAKTFSQGAPNLTLLVTAPAGVDNPAAAAAGAALARKLAAEPGVIGVSSYWTSGHSPQLRSRNGTEALIVATISGDETTVGKRFATLLPSLQGTHDGLSVKVGGFAALENALNVQGQKDATTGEMIVFPVTLVALVVIFGSVVAAALPLIVAVITMLLTLGVMWILASVTGLSSLSVGVVTLLGLGLAIDYSLLLVSRYREELRSRQVPSEAIKATMRSAGRTVMFSAVTVAAAASAMLWIPLQAVQSVGYAGIATALLAAATSVTLLPVLFAILGHRIERGRVLRRRRAVAAASAENGFWHGLALFVMRRPLPIAVTVTAVLLVLGAPFLSIKLGMPDERVLPASSVARQVAATIKADFNTSDENAIEVVASQAAVTPSVLSGYASGLSRLPGVAQVITVTGSYSHGGRTSAGGLQYQHYAAGQAVYLSVLPASGSSTADAEQLVSDIRATHAPFATLVGGSPAINLDASAAVEQRLPYALIWIAVVMVVLLFLVTGSVVLPFQALVLSCLSLTATFGALVWIFQDGHLAGLLGGFTATGNIAVTVPVLLFALSFGLAMDYQVFLLSRIREEYERTGSETEAVAMGLERTGGIVTAAAVLISLVFLAFLVSGISLDKAFGIGLSLAVLLDATLIRGAVLPAVMRLGGRATWWAPAPLRRLHAKFGMKETPAVPSYPRVSMSSDADVSVSSDAEG